MKKCVRLTLWIGLICIGVSAVVGFGQLKAQLEKSVSSHLIQHEIRALVHRPVVMRHVKLNWRFGMLPELDLTDVSIPSLRVGGRSIQLGHMVLRPSLIKSVFERRFVLSELLISGADLHGKWIDNTGLWIDGLGDIQQFVTPKREYKQDFRLPRFHITLTDFRGVMLYHHHRFQIERLTAHYAPELLSNAKLVVEYALHNDQDLSRLSLDIHQGHEHRYRLSADWEVHTHNLTPLLVFFQRSRALPRVDFLHGWGDFSVQALWDAGAPKRFNFNGQLGNLVIVDLESRSRALQLKLFSGSASWQKMAAQDWRLRLPHFSLNVNNHVISTHAIFVHHHLPVSKQVPITRVHVDHYQLALNKLLQPLWQHWVKDRQVQQKLVSMQGELSKLTMSVQGQRVSKLSAGFDNATLPAVGGLPDMAGVSGEVNLNDKQGWLSIASDALKLRFDHQPHWVLMGKGMLKGYFQRKQQHYHFILHQAQLSSPALSLTLRGTGDWERRGIDHPFLAGVYTVKDLHWLSTHVPLNWSNPQFRSWWSQADWHGRIEHGVVRWRGGADKRSYVSGKLKNVAVHYAPKWPSLQQALGNIAFSPKSMHVEISKGLIRGNQIDHATLSIADLTHPDLQVLLRASGQLQDAESMISDSPLPQKKQLTALDWRGPYGLTLDLHLPLYQRVMQIDFHGDVDFKHALLSRPSWPMSLTDLQGHLFFSPVDVTSDGLRAQLNQKPVKIRVHHQAGGHHPGLKIDVNGRINTVDLPRVKPIFHDDLLGSFPYLATIMVPDQASDVISMKLRSDLRGLQTQHAPQLIQDLMKSGAPLTLSLQRQSSSLIGVVVKWGHQFYGNGSLAMRQHHWALLNLLSYIGHPIPMKLCHGLCISGEVKTLDLKEWQLLFSRMRTLFPDHHGAVLQPVRAILHAKHIRYGALSLHDVMVAMHSVSSGLWVHVSGQELRGQALIPFQPHQPWSIILSSLDLSHLGLSDKAMSEVDWALPDLSVDARQVHYNNLLLSLLRFHLKPIDSGVRISNAIAVGRHFRVGLSGLLTSKGRYRTQLSGLLEADHFAATIPKSLQSVLFFSRGSGSVGFDLNSLDPLWRLSTDKLYGQLHFRLNDGQLLVKGRSFGGIVVLKLINLLNLSQLSQHLFFGFSDIGASSVNYSHFKGDVLLAGGEIGFHKLVLQAPDMKVSLDGRLNTIQNKVAMTVMFYPYVTSSVPAIMGFAGGPVLGAIGWVANKIVQPLLSHAMVLKYRVSGAMKNPVITPILRSANKHV